MTVFEYVLRSRRVVRPEGVGPAAILVRGGRIADVFPEADSGPRRPIPSDIRVIDVGESVVMPGLVDTHVHINEPGPSGGEGFETATRAAATGGVTTLIDMPSYGVPPTTNRNALDRKGEAAAGRLRVDVGFWGGLIPDNLAELSPLRAAGAFGYKCYLAPSGIPEFPGVTDHDLLLATERLGETPFLFHAEARGRLRPGERGQGGEEPGLASHPRAPEGDAVKRIVRLARLSRTPVHVLHLSCGNALETIRRAKDDGIGVTAETCPHYLVLSSDEIPDGAAGYGCSPPIGDRESRERLWQGLLDGTIDMVVSGHSDRRDARGGIPSLGLTLAATWTAARGRGFGFSDLARWLSAAPARLAGLSPWKGAIAAGRNADFVVWNPEAEWTVDATKVPLGGRPSPWAGHSLAGEVEATYLKGRKIYERGMLLSTPRGEILLAG